MNGSRAFATLSTVLGMEFEQLVGVGRRKLRSELYPRLPVSLDERYDPGKRLSVVDYDPVAANTSILRESLSEETRGYANRRLAQLQSGTLSFLNREVAVGDGLPSAVEYDSGIGEGFPLLWSLKLWAFEPVEWLLYGQEHPDASVGWTFVDWLESWEAAAFTDIDRTGYLRGYWTPYTVSRRIGNLGRLVALLAGDDEHERLESVSRHIEKNVRFLSDHVEYGVGGNHLIENGCALVLGGVLLEDDDVVEQGVSILTEELPAQSLEDGQHFERSPMYHTILLARVTTALDLLERTNRFVPDALRDGVHEMYWWLANVAPDDTGFPLLNDAVYGEGPSRGSCLRFVDTVLGDGLDAADQQLPRSGYYAVPADDMMVLVDGGRPSPPHLPAHGHNDIGNVVTWVADQPLLVDTGAYDYQPGWRRQYARSVEAHNTVQVGDVQQAVTGGRYVMGPQVEPDMSVFEEGSKRFVRVEYAAPRPVRKYRHKRVVSLGNGRLRIDDWVQSKHGDATARLHFHPDLDVDELPIGDAGENRYAVRESSMPTVVASIHGATTTELVETERYPEYGAVEKQPTLEASFEPTGNSADPSLSQILSVEDGDQ